MDSQNQLKMFPKRYSHSGNFREQITIENGLLLKNTRIIIQNSLQPELVEQIHEGHLSLEKCLVRARSTVYWPNMQKNLTEKLQSCPHA